MLGDIETPLDGRHEHVLNGRQPVEIGGQRNPVPSRSGSQIRDVVRDALQEAAYSPAVNHENGR